MCLSYGKLPNSDQHAIVWGDSNGNVSILLLRDFADLLRRWRTPMHLDVQPTISIAKVVLDEKVKFIRWQTHDEWVAKVHLEESTEKIISCCNRENTAVVIGHIEGSTPPFRDESCPVRQRRDPPSSQSSTSSRTPTSKRTVLKAASFSSPRLFSKFVAKKRISSDQLVFKIHKGVRVFEFSKKKNILVTGGMDRIIRIWNPYLTKSSIGKLIGHSSPTLCLTINVEEGFLISVSSDSCIKVWDLDNQVCLATSSAKGGPQAGELQACAYSPFTRSVLLISDEISLVELMKNESVADEQRRAAHQSWDCHGGCRFGRDLTSRQNTLVGLDQQGLLRWEPVLTHKAPVTACKYNRTFNQVITACSNSTIKVWNFATGQLVFEFSEAHGSGAVTCMCFDLTDRRLITGGQDGYVRIWNHHTGACIQELRPDSKHEEEFSVSAVGCINIGTVR
uniref:WD_REPEATS_REGION domain-containing protein n=1 Tax=Mesocestoides corti TaxID=53468 RepID=A0A5K3F763_MESCO